MAMNYPGDKGGMAGYVSPVKRKKNKNKKKSSMPSSSTVSKKDTNYLNKRVTSATPSKTRSKPSAAETQQMLQRYRSASLPNKNRNKKLK